ncbi:MAG: hypothetical protein JRI68_19925 [Deltaproteobacteria bacterium]|nr:hypothetical protein [Deltaproteobacteria bacterium]
MRFGSPLIALAAVAVISCGTNVLFKPGSGGSEPTSSSSSTTSGTGGSGGSTTSTSGTGGSTTSTSGSGGSTTSTSGTGGAGGVGGVGGGGGATCTDAFVTVEPAHLPVDAIVAVANTQTMSGAHTGIEQHLYSSFVSVLESFGVDVQVIVVSAHGAGFAELCIPPPLSGSNNCYGPPGNVPGKFRHYSATISWSSTLCKLLDTLYGTTPDEFNLAPGGWSTWLRPTALKAFVAMDSYQTNCSYNSQLLQDMSQSGAGQQVALTWDNALLGLAPGHFGTSADRRYVFHSLVGMTPKPNNQPYEPFEEVIVTSCSNYQPGTAFQWLSKGTEGWRYSLCNSPSYPAIFTGLAANIADRTEEVCAFQAPDPPPGFEPLNLSLLSMLYTPSNGPLQPLSPVPSLSACSGDGFYWDGDAARLCPATCDTITADPNALLEFRFHCPGP